MGRKKALSPFSILPLAALALCAGCVAPSHDRPPFYVLFTEGREDSDMSVSHPEADVRQDAEGHYLALDPAGADTLTLTFPLPSEPDRLYALFDWRAEGGEAVYMLRVNGREVDRRIFQWDTYMTLGEDIAEHCQAGENTVELRLAPGSAGLAVRGAMISDTPSLLATAQRVREKQGWSAKRLLPIFIGIGILFLIPLAVSILRRALSGAMAPIPYRASLAAFLFGALSVAFAWFCVRPLFWFAVGLFGGIVLLIIVSFGATRRAQLGQF